MYLPLSNQAYARLGQQVAHPSRRQATLEWDGSGISKPAPVEYRIERGIAKYINKFCTLNRHPSTFIDQRPEYMQATPMMPPHIMNWQTVNSVPSVLASPITPAAFLAYLMAPMGAPLSVLVSPFDMETSAVPVPLDERPSQPGQRKGQPHTMCMDEWYPTARPQMVPRSMALDELSIDYLYMVAVWWRIPAASVASYTRTETTPTMRAAGVLEALGTEYLWHPELVKESIQEKRREYMRKWRANYQGPRT